MIYIIYIVSTVIAMEVELKLLVDPADRDKVLKYMQERMKGEAGKRPALRRQQLHATYFDTPDLHLRRRDAGLRVRKVDGRWIQTMKAGGTVVSGLHSRHEWEMPVDGPEPELMRLAEAIGTDSEWHRLIATPSLADRLQPLFTVSMERTVCDWCDADAEIEMVFDEGTIERGKKKVPVSEIELELKSGSPLQLYRAALDMLERFPLRLGHASKAERGYALIDDHVPEEGLDGMQAGAAVKAQPVSFPKEATVEQGMQAIFLNCLAQMQSNERGVAEQNDPESLHQMRVGLRRLRSAIRMFEDVAPCPQALRDELSWLGSALGAARDWDVLSTSTISRIPGEQDSDAIEAAPLRLALAEMRRVKRAGAAEALLSPRYARLLLTLNAWLQAAGWRDELDAQAVHGLERPLSDFAGKMIKRGHDRILRRGKGVASATPDAMHRLRIACKRNRYAVEFFQALCKPRRARRYLAALTGMQDELGWRNDVSVADGLLRELQSEHPQAGAAAEFARGYLLAHRQGKRKTLRRAWKACRQAELPIRRR